MCIVAVPSNKTNKDTENVSMIQSNMKNANINEIKLWHVHIKEITKFLKNRNTKYYNSFMINQNTFVTQNI